MAIMMTATDVVLVLPNHDGIFVQIRYVGSTDSPRILLEDHPAEMTVEQALAN